MCNLVTGSHCTAPPIGAKFYPFWTMTNLARQGLGLRLFPSHACIWNFGNVITGVTKRNFGKAKQYGAPAISVYGGTLISALMANPEVSGSCPKLTRPH
jgi:hypothetical protein